MRLQCDAIDCARGSKDAANRPAKGFLSLGLLKVAGQKLSVPHLSVDLSNGKKWQYALDGSCRIESVMEKFLSTGKATINWAAPARMTLISGARPEYLRNFLSKLRSAMRGEPMGDNRVIDEVKKADFNPGPRSLIVTAKGDYPSIKDGFPSSLTKLVLNGIGLQKVDGRWFACTQLTELDLGNNRLGRAPDMAKLKLLSRLVSLQSLSLANNGLEMIPEGIMAALPPSLEVINLSRNALQAVPPLHVSRFPSLRMLDVSHNAIEYLPYEYRGARISLNASHNAIRWIPYIVSSDRNIFDLSSNPLNEPLSVGSVRFSEQIPPLIELTLIALRGERSQPSARFSSLTDLPRNADPIFHLMQCDFCRYWKPKTRIAMAMIAVPSRQFCEAAAYNTAYPTKVWTCKACALTKGI